MKIVRAESLSYVPAGHEQPDDPGVWKKVLFARDDLQPGYVPMVNWSRLPPGRSFAAHFHENMQEVFIILQGEAEITIGDEVATLRAGDAVRIEPREVHLMRNPADEDCLYIAFGIASGPGGRTVQA